MSVNNQLNYQNKNLTALPPNVVHSNINTAILNNNHFTEIPQTLKAAPNLVAL